MITKKIVSFFNQFSSKYLDIKLIRSSNYIKDFRKTTTNPMVAYYNSGLSPFIIEISLEKVRISKWFNVTDQSYSPLFIATKNYIDNSHSISILFEYLKKYTSKININNANKALGLDSENSNYPIDAHPFEAVMPWEKLTPSEKFIKRSKSVNIENNTQGLNTLESLSYQATDRKINVEVQRLSGIVKSVEKNGFLLDFENMIEVVVLLKENDYRFLVSAGQHRVAVLSALEYSKIPVQVNAVINRIDVEYWPNVMRGFYSKEVALDIFDRCFDSILPVVFKEWQIYVDSANNGK